MNLYGVMVASNIRSVYADTVKEASDRAEEIWGTYPEETWLVGSTEEI